MASLESRELLDRPCPSFCGPPPFTLGPPLQPAVHPYLIAVQGLSRK
ncbi:MAG: hypothetical protein HY671_11775 [Chloroflexi bacterium]|nr:hypothetical protein [Chloroflexota bacterium]